ncbi:uncharacterized protein PHACADRAFT_184086 [Phanerochaete carnosa HHB-10118-sp]|uniref:Cytosine-specific methyltransferase n=1 Tax=Phanerochaete carnosa (strain HHB-10118-sp) TaxID=650164 RepID=K5VUR0_PHACS|nr:uncharacterized protein PHACADRAFT_184086 [Phanerochaete carnosa HHB-10118-sp]EKM55273.1 hypothetical protein PHACADRAFT_184086 [Phanerochaete carnosa HHB-10118-sp]
MWVWPFRSEQFPTACIRRLLINYRAPARPPADPSGSQETGTQSRFTVFNAACKELEEESLTFPEEAVPHGFEDNKIPIRALEDFVVYEIKTGRIAYLEEVDCSRAYGASGYASSWIDNEIESLSDSSEFNDESLEPSTSTSGRQRIRLSGILEVNVHHVCDSDPQTFQLDPEPAQAYADHFMPFRIKHYLFHELVSCVLQDPDHQLTLEEFGDWLSLSESSTSSIQVSRVHRVKQQTHHFSESFKTLCKKHKDIFTPLRGMPILVSLLDPSRGLHARKLKSIQELRNCVLAAISKTTVTSGIFTLAARLFPQKHLQKVLVNTHEHVHCSGRPNSRKIYRMHDMHVRHEWGQESHLRARHYESVTIDGVLYKLTSVKAGDTVIVEGGPDADRTREKNATTEPAKTGDDIVDKKWFMKICYVFERQEQVISQYSGPQWILEPYFHGQYYMHGSKLLLQETAHPQALYLIDECDDQQLGCIFQKVDVQELGLQGDEPPFLNTGTSTKQFFSGLLWDQAMVAFHQLSPNDIQRALNACTPGKECINCGLSQLRMVQNSWDIKEDRILQHDVSYHVGDFVYLRPTIPTPPELYVIGQITEIMPIKGKGEHQVRVRLIERYDVVIRTKWGPRKEGTKTDEHRLILTDELQPFDVSHIEGKAYVTHPSSLQVHGFSPDDWVLHDDHYLIDLRAPSIRAKCSQMEKLLPRQLHYCQTCFAQRLKTLQVDRDLLEQHGPLRCLELFAGAGGLASGLHQSGFVETKWAVESSPSAALSFAANNPRCTVYTQCSNVLLRHAIETQQAPRSRPRQVASLNHKDKDALPPMPKPGEVDFICGGPPCQSFSGANRWKKADDIRSTLICNTISYVDFYRPKYFLLENVTGLLSVPLGTEKQDQMTDGVAMGVVKFIFRALVSLGYQVHCKVLQAAQYGTPQSRERVIFWAARRDVPLPDFPYPTHHFAKGVRSFNLPTGEVLHRPVRVAPHESAKRSEYAQYAPLCAITVEDAIGDLQKFDWLPSGPLTDEDIHRLAQGIVRFEAVTNREARFPYAGYCGKGTAFLHPPLNRYQMQAREGLDVDDNVVYHYTQKFSAKIVDRVLHVPLRAGANHQDLPPQYRDKRKLQPNGKSKKEYERHYKRIDRDSHFMTMLTTVKPSGTNAIVLHPTQKRVLTIRECARAQGFPDSHKFLSVHSIPAKVVEDQLRQIGNAVPVPLARALGKELGKVLLKTWREEAERELSPEVAMEVDN